MSVSSLEAFAPRSNVALAAAARARRWLAEVEREARVGGGEATWPTLRGEEAERLCAAVEIVRRLPAGLAPSGSETPWDAAEDAETLLPPARAGTPAPRIAEGPRAGQKLGPWVLEAEIGRGAYGSVFRARHALIDRRAAIKVLTARAATDPTQRAKLRLEARAIHRVEHPAVVDVFDIGPLDAPRPYLVMELLEGRTLHERFRREGAMPVEEAVALLRPVAEALDRAHGRGVVHRDVKPDNIFLERRPEAGLRSRLIDFGVARIHGLEQVSGREDHLVGTPRYMAPEVVDGGPAEGPADLYALGVCLYELLVGRAPFVGRSALDILWQHLDRAPRPPSSAVAHLPAIVDAVVLALLEKDPRDRPSTAAEAWDVLERI